MHLLLKCIAADEPASGILWKKYWFLKGDFSQDSYCASTQVQPSNGRV